MRNPIGLHAQAQSKDFNRTAFLRHAKAANYTTCTVLDDLTLAIDLAKQGMPYPVFRSYAWEPQPDGNTPEAGRAAGDNAFGQLVAWRKTHPGSENVLFMVNCERGFGLGVSWMYVRLIQRCATEVSPPIGLVVGNWASGAVKCGQAGEPNAWIDAGEPLLRALEKYGNVRLPNGSKAFVLGVHEYTAIHAWIASNGGRHQNTPLWKDRPLAIDWSLPQWHLGRMAQGVMKACQHFKIAEYPAMMVTECLFDTMNDVIDRLGVLKLAPGYDKPRGWRSLVPQWKEWYPGRDPAAVLADMHIWTWETIYAPLGFVIGAHTYSYGNTGTWESFQVDKPDGAAYLSRMETYRPATSPTLPPQTPPIPDPPAPPVVIPPPPESPPEPPPGEQVAALLLALELSNATLVAAMNQLQETITLNNLVIEKIKQGV